jgi:hypothetical protein
LRRGERHGESTSIREVTVRKISTDTISIYIKGKDVRAVRVHRVQGKSAARDW